MSLNANRWLWLPTERALKDLYCPWRELFIQKQSKNKILPPPLFIYSFLPFFLALFLCFFLQQCLCLTGLFWIQGLAQRSWGSTGWWSPHVLRSSVWSSSAFCSWAVFFPKQTWAGRISCGMQEQRWTLGRVSAESLFWLCNAAAGSFLALASELLSFIDEPRAQVSRSHTGALHGCCLVVLGALPCSCPSNRNSYKGSNAQQKGAEQLWWCGCSPFPEICLS